MKIKEKVILLISSAAAFTVACFSTHSVARALYQKDASDTSFSIGLKQETKTSFYLKGNFNTWETSEDYKFSDVTSTMTPETGKIAEYKLANISLAKNDVLKVADSKGNWYSNFYHCFDNSISYDGDGNYKVLMTSSKYDVFFKVYETGDPQIYIRAQKDVVYFKPSNSWKSESAKFAVYYFKSGENKWEWITTKSPTDDSVYKITIPSDYIGESMILCRMNKDATALNWDNKWNQSADLSLANTNPNNFIELPENTWDNWQGNQSAV